MMKIRLRIKSLSKKIYLFAIIAFIFAIFFMQAHISLAQNSSAPNEVFVEATQNPVENGVGINFNKSSEVTREDAMNAILEAQAAMQELIDAGLNPVAVNDTIVQAKQAFERAEFAYLINTNAKGLVAERARRALEGLNYSEFTYDNVVRISKYAVSLKDYAFDLSDALAVTEARIYSFKNKKINTTISEQMIKNAQLAFEKARYAEAAKIINKIEGELERERRESTTVKLLTLASKNFIAKYWKESLVLVVILLVLGYFIYRKLKIKNLEKKLRYLENEKKTIELLMKKAQKDRFVNKKLSATVYNVRMEKYTQKLSELKSEIPVIADELKQFKNKKHHKIYK